MWLAPVRQLKPLIDPLERSNWPRMAPVAQFTSQGMASASLASTCRRRAPMNQSGRWLILTVPVLRSSATSGGVPACSIWTL